MVHQYVFCFYSGVPKGAMLSHGNIVANVAGAHMQLVSDDIYSEPK